MQTTNNILIDELLHIVESTTVSAKKFKQLSDAQLKFKKSPESWSVLECIEHLNLYGDFYLPEIQKEILNAEKVPSASIVKSGAIGNYFANLMKVKDGKLKKMKSPADKNPATSELSFTTIDRFLKQQELLKQLLLQSRTVNLTKTKTSISLTRLIRLRLGDTLRFLVYHMERHIQQAVAVHS